ncbi:unnamed protein product, partial [Mesorhabditis spiculigera]
MAAGSTYYQLVSFEGGKVTLFEQNARSTFAHERYRNKKIAFVSVAGPARSGKSFLVAYLTSGFFIRGRFKSGYARDTEGILICDTPWVLEDQTVVFFLDTQGTFDLETEPIVSELIMAFSLLVSGLQIINLRVNIDGDDLRMVHRSVEAVNAMKRNAVGEKLLFLIRDAADPKVKGEDVLAQLWESGKASQELSEARESLQRRYKIACIPLPVPSDNVKKGNNTATICTGKDNADFSKKLQCVKEYLRQHTVGASSTRRMDWAYWQEIAAFLNNAFPRYTSRAAVTQNLLLAHAIESAFNNLDTTFSKATLENIDQRKLHFTRILEGRIKKQHLGTLQTQAIQQALDQMDVDVETFTEYATDQERLLKGEIEALRKNIAEAKEFVDIDDATETAMLTNARKELKKTIDTAIRGREQRLHDVLATGEQKQAKAHSDSPSGSKRSFSDPIDKTKLIRPGPVCEKNSSENEEKNAACVDSLRKRDPIVETGGTESLSPPEKRIRPEQTDRLDQETPFSPGETLQPATTLLASTALIEPNGLLNQTAKEQNELTERQQQSKPVQGIVADDHGNERADEALISECTGGDSIKTSFENSSTIEEVSPHVADAAYACEDTGRGSPDGWNRELTKMPTSTSAELEAPNSPSVIFGTKEFENLPDEDICNVGGNADSGHHSLNQESVYFEDHRSELSSVIGASQTLRNPFRASDARGKEELPNLILANRRTAAEMADNNATQDQTLPERGTHPEGQRALTKMGLSSLASTKEKPMTKIPVAEVWESQEENGIKEALARREDPFPRELLAVSPESEYQHLQPTGSEYSGRTKRNSDPIDGALHRDFHAMPSAANGLVRARESPTEGHRQKKQMNHEATDKQQNDGSVKDYQGSPLRESGYLNSATAEKVEAILKSRSNGCTGGQPNFVAGKHDIEAFGRITEVVPCGDPGHNQNSIYFNQLSVESSMPSESAISLERMPFIDDAEQPRPNQPEDRGFNGDAPFFNNSSGPNSQGKYWDEATSLPGERSLTVELAHSEKHVYEQQLRRDPPIGLPDGFVRNASVVLTSFTDASSDQRDLHQRDGISPLRNEHKYVTQSAAIFSWDDLSTNLAPKNGTAKSRPETPGIWLRDCEDDPEAGPLRRQPSGAFTYICPPFSEQIKNAETVSEQNSIEKDIRYTTMLLAPKEAQSEAAGEVEYHAAQAKKLRQEGKKKPKAELDDKIRLDMEWFDVAMDRCMMKYHKERVLLLPVRQEQLRQDLHKAVSGCTQSHQYSEASARKRRKAAIAAYKAATQRKDFDQRVDIRNGLDASLLKTKEYTKCFNVLGNYVAEKMGTSLYPFRPTDVDYDDDIIIKRCVNQGGRRRIKETNEYFGGAIEYLISHYPEKWSLLRTIDYAVEYMHFFYDVLAKGTKMNDSEELWQTLQDLSMERWTVKAIAMGRIKPYMFGLKGGEYSSYTNDMLQYVGQYIRQPRQAENVQPPPIHL